VWAAAADEQKRKESRLTPKLNQQPTSAEMAATDNHILFQDIFDVIKVNPEGKKFDKGASRESTRGRPRSPSPPQ
jgi:hypothetical protein